MELGMRRMPGQCYTCGQFGHFSKECPSRRERPFKPGGTNQTTGGDRRFKKATLTAAERSHSHGQGIKEDYGFDSEEEEEDNVNGFLEEPTRPAFR